MLYTRGVLNREGNMVYRLQFVLVLLASAVLSFAQSPAPRPTPPSRPPAIVSPEVQSDNNVTFRLAGLTMA